MKKKFCFLIIALFFTAILTPGTAWAIHPYDGSAAASAINFRLDIINGRGHGWFATGTQVTIIAEAGPPGTVFYRWEIRSGGGTLANPTSRRTIYTMPANNATLEAIYINDTACGTGVSAVWALALVAVLWGRRKK